MADMPVNRLVGISITRLTDKTASRPADLPTCPEVDTPVNRHFGAPTCRRLTLVAVGITSRGMGGDAAKQRAADRTDPGAGQHPGLRVVAMASNVWWRDGAEAVPVGR
ncbi:hypothetical protein [Dankookia sp. GCM10030260]|uniref:hypothetical protein n=1 Tax=Dankookia sp. GCM10030260 TaxID=3273390 RepID=UPI0036D20931